MQKEMDRVDITQQLSMIYLLRGFPFSFSK